MSLLELKNVHTYYGHIHALKGISLTVEEGEIVTLIGSNGAGKTTTLRTISGLVKPRQGEVLVQGRPIHRLPAHDRPPLDRAGTSIRRVRCARHHHHLRPAGSPP